jgi:hypothetical protein
MKLTIKLIGGLGNQLFQLAALESIAKQTGKQFFIHTLKSNFFINGKDTIHSTEQYFTTIFKNWRLFYKSHPILLLEESSKMYSKINKFEFFSYCLQGFFQDYKYVELIKSSFIPRLSFNESILLKYPEITSSIFVHVRGLDFLYLSDFKVDLENYYTKCFELCKDFPIVVFTNDISHANTILKGKTYTIVNESEVDTLYLMSKCKGGVLSTSTFAWWGAYLTPNRPIYVPSYWNTSADIKKLYLPEWTIIHI